MERAKESATRAISIRIPIADLEHASRIDGQTGVGYQTVLKRAIREGLKRAGLKEAGENAPISYPTSQLGQQGRIDERTMH
jgi:hypothetical protein